jgi:hypothetical protein
VSEVSLVEWQVRNRLRKTVDEIATGTLAQILARKLSSDPTNFVTCQKLLSGLTTRSTLCEGKYELQVSLELSKLPSQTSDTCERSWKENTEEEALLGVSMTGILDHPVLAMKSDGDLWFNNGARVPLSEILEELKNEAVATNKTWAKKLGIKQSAAITCVKPSGTVSQLVDSASGIHGRFADHYIRRVRADSRDPLCSVLEAAGVPVENDNLSPTTKVFSFVKKAPEGAVMASEQTGLEQLELWTMYQEHWCEHKPSITVYYRDTEYLAIGNWLIQ